ncbi:MAG: VWA domain-containing protein [Fimbriimonadales bacterium]|nr:VWA domain-containing protein [Fimbriimonadales bacterium]
MRRWIGAIVGLGVLLSACAPRHQVHSLPTASRPSNERVLMVDYFKSDAPRLQADSPNAFTVRCDTPGVQVDLVGWKDGKARRPQQRQRALSILIAWDQSASLESTDPTLRRFEAGARLIQSLPNNARLGMVNFASLGFEYADYDLRAPMGSPKTQLLNALEFLKRSDFSFHGTPIWNTLVYAIPQLLANEPAERERCVILFTDGQNEIAGVSHTEHEALEVAQRHRARLIFVLLGNEQTIATYPEVVRTLNYLANATDGAVIAADEAQDLNEAFGAALDTLEYAPVHRLHVRVRKPGGFRRGETLTLRVQASGGKERVVQVRL